MDFSANDIFEFTTESLELLDQAETSLLAIDKGGDFPSMYDAIFRVFHSLKGGSGMLGLLALQSHMHSLENILASVKTKPTLTSDEISFFLSGVDASRRLLSGEKVSFEYVLPGQGKPASAPAPAAPPVAALSTPTAPVAKPVAQPAPQPAKSASSKGLAYIADDEQIILDALGDLLEEAGLEIKTFLNPKELIETAKKNPPDLVFTDLKMPEMTGIEMLKNLRSFNPDVPVIIVSGFVTSEALIEAVEQGIFAAVEKPFKKESIIGYTMAALRQHNVLKVLRRSIKMLIYQFTDLEDFLKANGKEDLAKTARFEINQLMAQWKELTASKR